MQRKEKEQRIALIYTHMKIYPISSLLMLVKKCKSDTTQEFHKDSKGSV